MHEHRGRIGNFASLLAIAVAYSVIHAGLRYAASRTLVSEDSLSLVYAQSWALGYTSDKPPLYIWMLKAAETLTGANIIAVLVLRYGLLIATVVFAYLAACRLLQDRLWALLAALSLSLCYEIGWSVHEGVTYTAALTPMIMATLWSVFRLRDRGAWYDYAVFGSFCAFGLLSNYNFVFFLVALLIAGFSLPQFRSRLDSPWAFFSLLIGIALVAPFCIWLVTANGGGRAPEQAQAAIASRSQEAQGEPLLSEAGKPPGSARAAPSPSVMGQLGGRFGQLLEKGYFHRSLTALINMIEGPIVFLFPLIPLLLLLFPGVAPDFLRALRSFGREGLENDKERLLLRMTIVALTLLLLAVLIGFDRGGSQYMHPLLLPTVLLLVALAKDQPQASRRIPAYVLTLLAVCVGVVGLRALALFAGPPVCRSCEMWERFEPLAEALRSAAPDKTTILVADRAAAGNLRQLLPMARVAIAEPGKLIPRRVKLDAGAPVAVVSRAEAASTRQAVKLFCEALHKNPASGVTPREFIVAADWRPYAWAEPHAKSSWRVSVYEAGEPCR